MEALLSGQFCEMLLFLSSRTGAFVLRVTDPQLSSQPGKVQVQAVSLQVTMTLGERRHPRCLSPVDTGVQRRHMRTVGGFLKLPQRFFFRLKLSHNLMSMRLFVWMIPIPLC